MAQANGEGTRCKPGPGHAPLKPPELGGKKGRERKKSQKKTVWRSRRGRGKKQKKENSEKKKNRKKKKGGGRPTREALSHGKKAPPVPR